MAPYKNFVKNLGIIGATDALVALERIILLPIITKLLSVGDYGVWVQFGVTISLIPTFALLGLKVSMVRFLVGEKDQEKVRDGIYSVLTVVFFISLIISLFLFFLAQPIAGFFQTSPDLVKILALVIFLECLIQVFLNVFQIFQEVGKYSNFTLLRTLGELGLVVAAIFLGYGLFGAVLSLLIIRLLIFLILLVIFLKKVGFFIPTFKQLKEYLSFGIPRVISSISYWTVAASDRYLIGFFLGTIFVGYYAPAYTIGNILNFFLYPFFFMLPIVLSKSFDENKLGEVKTYLKYSLKYFLMIAIPSVFGLSILSKQLLIIFSTPEIASHSYYVTPFVALSILLYGITAFFGQIIMLVKKTRISSNIWTAVALLNLGLNFIFIPRWGILGAALTTLLAYAAAFGLSWYFSSRELKFEMGWKFIMKSVLASTLMTLFIAFLNPLGLLETVLAIIAGISLYGITIFLLRGISEKEISFLKGLFDISSYK